MCLAKGIGRGGLFSVLNCGNLSVLKLETNLVLTKIEMCEIFRVGILSFIKMCYMVLFKLWYKGR